MRAAVVDGPGRLVVTDVPDPVPDGKAVVAVRLAGICGTDVKILEGAVPVGYPRIIGHELVGEVVEAQSGGLPSGTRVLVDPTVSCGRCRLCRDDNGHLCKRGGLMGRDLDGGFAELIAVDDRQLLRVPDGLGAADSTLVQVLGTCVHGQRLVDVLPWQTAVVIGLGVSGLMHLQLLRARGVERVVGVTRSARKLALAEQFGAHAVATPEEARAVVDEVTGGQGADLVVESVGRVETLAQSIDLATTAGTLLVFGTTSASEGKLPFYQLYHKELSIRNSRGARARDYERALELAVSGRLSLAPLVTAAFSLDRAEDAFRSHAEGQLKVALDLEGALGETVDGDGARSP